MANETTITTTVVVAVISALMGGTGMTLLNYFFNRKKVEAEIQKMKAETNKIYLEIKNLSDTVSYSLSDYSEKILFDARNKIDGFDIKGHEGQFWKDNKRIGEIGRGYLRFEEGGVFNIQRTNTEGRFEIQLIRYIYIMAMRII